MIRAEQEVAARKGCVLRLSGLYNRDKGAHAYWMKSGIVQVAYS